jgi:hypothetical protein
LVIGAICTFAFGVLGRSVWGVTRVVSKTMPTPSFSLVISPSPIPTPTAVNYILPYPGVLPDSPLYMIKMIRDKIVLMLTGDPLKKTEKLLLYADKRLGAAQALMEGNKTALGITTITKAEKYLEQAVNEFQKAKNSKGDTSRLKEQLKLATAKHEELLTGFLSTATGETKTALEEALKNTLNSKNILLKE